MVIQVVEEAKKPREKRNSKHRHPALNLSLRRPRPSPVAEWRLAVVNEVGVGCAGGVVVPEG